ncbi:MAG: nucleotidyltransferase domain-containing protein [Syntrophobacterales bacterium CG03_land_8_20_14_0_80_58_14]|nr:MAG: nucleotidyltransferase domain-containing protein [Syntrophobacterales bacterium CG03_land_8_20_14_0_80_58_14]
MMEKEILRKVKEAVRTIEPDAEIYLYGSRSRQDARSDSDWDFLILVDGMIDTVRTDRIRHVLYEIEWETGEVLSSIVRSRADWHGSKYQFIPLRINIEREGLLI